MHARAHALDLAQQRLAVGLDVLEVDLAHVRNEQRRLRVMEEELVERGGELLEIARAQVRLGLASALANAIEEHFGARLEVDDEVRLRQLRVEQRVDAVVEAELLLVERDRREDAVLREQVIRDDARVEEVALLQPHLLLVTREQIEELSLECVRALVLVEAREERI